MVLPPRPGVSPRRSMARQSGLQRRDVGASSDKLLAASIVPPPAGPSNDPTLRGCPGARGRGLHHSTARADRLLQHRGARPGASGGFLPRCVRSARRPGGVLSVPASGEALGGAPRQDPADKVIYLGVETVSATLDAVKANGGSVGRPRFWGEGRSDPRPLHGSGRRLHGPCRAQGRISGQTLPAVPVRGPPLRSARREGL
jgi:hypothetical protein